ncbi:MAG: endolytic transglycosylase MltG, partial [Rectinema sp.]|nr:endolytic transglycosylase MltG [Rectinema sp.]
QTAGILERAGIVKAASFIMTANDGSVARRMGIPAATCEGYLSPDTYFLEPGSEPEEIIQQMVSTFRRKIASFGMDHLDPEQLHKAVILASLVEREYRLPEDAPLIASVFFNRLSRNMPLQSCASVVYVLTEHLRRPHPSVVYYRDLKIQDTYNTYIHRGLPPGPIANPGIVSLKAVLFPLKTDYLYFRLMDVQSGKHFFSRTLEEHSEAAIFAKELQDR